MSAAVGPCRCPSRQVGRAACFGPFARSGGLTAGRASLGLCLASLFACASDPPAGAQGNTYIGVQNTTVLTPGLPLSMVPVGEAPGIVGRTVRAAAAATPLSYRVSWAASQMSFHFYGSALSLELVQTHLPSPLSEQAGWQNHFDVITDGVPNYDSLVLSEGAATYPVAQNLPLGEHTIVLRKRSEASEAGDVELRNASLNANGIWLAPRSARSRRIEVIGASNETGRGVHGVAPCSANERVSNALAGWPVFVADRLDADLHNISISGQGVLGWSVPLFDANNNPVAGQSVSVPPMPTVWGYIDSEDPSTAWDPAQFVPQVVIFTLGPNDYDRGLIVDDAARAALVDHYTRFVVQVNVAYANPLIYLLLNPLQDVARRETLGPDLQAVVDGAQKAGVAQISVLTLPIYNGAAMGCEGHPDIHLQISMASQIGDKIGAQLGW